MVVKWELKLEDEGGSSQRALEGQTDIDQICARDNDKTRTDLGRSRGWRRSQAIN